MTQPLFLVPAGRTIPALDALMERAGAEEVEVVRVTCVPPVTVFDDERPTVVLLDAALARCAGAAPAAIEAIAQRAALVALGEPGDDRPRAALPAELLSGFLPADATDAPARATLLGALRHAVTLVSARSATRLAERRAADLAELSRIGVALSTECDLLTLLHMILTHARQICSADAGSLYLVEHRDGSPDSLRFKLSQNDSLVGIPFGESEMPLDHASLAGYVATTGETLNIPDVYLLPDDAVYRQNRTFDERFGYRTRSVLVIPMRTHRDEMIGVLQLINRRRDGDEPLTSAEAVDRAVVPFDEHTVDVVRALASQAAVAIENGRLAGDIERLFEGFVTAAVTAIESRDPATSGHAVRVATLTCALAEVVDRADSGPYRETRFSRAQLRELRYAGLLHDFGKVGVRERVLVKQKKLYGSDLAIIRHRFHLLLEQTDTRFERERADYLLVNGADGYQEALASLERSRRAAREELQGFLDAIVRANEPTVVREGAFDELAAINERTFVDFEGVDQPLLGNEELRYLMIDRGNLDERERREIESHVTHTFRFLEQIPWTRELRGIPGIAYGHHEKLNGTGYPRRLGGDDISVQTRMITIADIFDALTATDRPYKRAVAPERALVILHDEARQGALDPALLDAFVAARVWESYGSEPSDN